jgi:Uma2 family endonuclease
VTVDRRVRLPLYARAGVREAWLLDRSGDRVEVHRGPTAEGYRDVSALARGPWLTPLAFPDLIVTVDELLG